MRTLWALSQFEADSVTGILTPVAADYANAYVAPANPQGGIWSLVQIQSDPPQIAAMLLDTRVVYAGTVWDTPPAEVMTVYAAYLLGTETLMGQVLNELGNQLDAQFSPQ
jgi:hypothetical protein